MRRNLLLGSACALMVAAVPAVAVAHDRNHDGLPDGWERHHGLSLKHNQANRDQDHDGLRNKQEHRFGFDPRRRDTDHDGVVDGQENAGTIASFTGGVLTIKLADGSTLAGKVDASTEIECKTAPSLRTGQVARTAEHGSGDDDQGDDDDRDEVGDDHGDDDHNRASCGTDQLTAGKVVHEAELKAGSTGAVFEEVQLVG